MVNDRESQGAFIQGAGVGYSLAIRVLQINGVVLDHEAMKKSLRDVAFGRETLLDSPADLAGTGRPLADPANRQTFSDTLRLVAAAVLAGIYGQGEIA